ncbi:uncharacterized protein LOC116253460 [Nymphaea colorata]|nr:uncharacterized protein LOC116253460 [Nymphaea colorata]
MWHPASLPVSGFENMGVLSLRTKLWLLALSLVTATAVAEGTGECGSKGPMAAAMKLLPCLKASEDIHAHVSVACCEAVQEVIRDPQCFCAMVSLGSSQQGLSPTVAMSVPKRCGIPHSPTCPGARLP